MDEVTIPEWVVRHVGTISLQAAAQTAALQAQLTETQRLLNEAHSLLAAQANGHREPADASATLEGGPMDEPRFEIRPSSGEPIVTLHADGTVEVNPKYETDEAVRSFCDAVRRHAVPFVTAT